MAIRKNKNKEETDISVKEEEVPPAEAEAVTEDTEIAASVAEQLPVAVKDGGEKVIPKVKLLTKEQKRKKTALRWVLLNVGIIMMSLSVYFFQTPNNFTLGGVAGIAILLANMIPVEFFSQAVVMAIINVFLLILGFIILGKQCTLYTIYCSLLYTGIILLLEKVLPLSIIPGTVVNPDTGMVTLTNQPFLEMVYAILLFGVGGALIFNCGASSGGTDIIALILKKFTKINVGVALMIIDCIVVCISIFAFESVTTALFSFMGLFAKSVLLDGVIESIGKTKYITIITTKPDEIGKYILEVINHGYTKYDAEGGYTNEKKKILVTVCKKGEALRLKIKAKQLDPEAFIIITDAKEILGRGFVETL